MYIENMHHMLCYITLYYTIYLFNYINIYKMYLILEFIYIIFNVLNMQYMLKLFIYV